MIQLTDQEEELFTLLLDVVKSSNRSTILRVAGGWVRDKLLQKDSHDIDIALDDQSGLEFATLVNEYLKQRNLETRTIAVIQANPDQSKHLETVNVKVLGIEIDFVHLRTETYTETRIPQIQTGTAQEDAMRRDFTINSLFFNIHSRTVEDFSGMGMPDLQQGIIRTPIDPLITFRDDPLRILRAIRFSSRLFFRLDSALVSAARDADIRLALQEKVSRERVYKECEGMMNHSQIRPAFSFLLIHYLNILDVVLPVEVVLSKNSVVFASSEGEAAREWSREYGLPSIAAPSLQLEEARELSSWKEVAAGVIYWIHILTHLRANSYQTRQVSRQEQCEIDRVALSMGAGAVKGLYWAGAVVRLAGLAVMEKKKEVSLPVHLLREALKMENQTLKHVSVLLDAARSFLSIVTDVEALTLDTAAQLLRQSRELWHDALLLATAYVLAHTSPVVRTQLLPRMQGFGEGNMSEWFADLRIEEAEWAVISRFLSIERKISEVFRLEGVWNLKPLLDVRKPFVIGSSLVKALGVTLKGPIVGKLMEEQIRWQIHYLHDPNVTVDDCLLHLRSFLPS